MTLKPSMLVLTDAMLYLIFTLGFALIWHLYAFAPLYTSLNWPSPEEADVPLGFLAVATQGVILAILFQGFAEKGKLSRIIPIFCVMSFVFLWSSHVIGDAAKCNFLPKSSFVAIETLYLAIQFIIFGLALTFIHRNFDARFKAQPD